MSTCLLMISDGRLDYFERTVASAQANLPSFDHRVLVDDSDHSLGFAGAVQEGWRRVLKTEADFVFHLEDDWTFNEPVALERMITAVEHHPHLSQMSLLRQPWNSEEKAAGGLIEAHPDQYTEYSDEDFVWTETSRFAFTTNPSVYPTELCKRGWPDAPESEGKFSNMLLREGKFSGIWGRKADPPRVEHIGAARTGTGY